MKHVTIGQNVAHTARRLNFKGCRVAAVFFGLLRHQTYIGNSARGCRIQSARFFKIFNRFVINGRIAIVRNDTFCICSFAIWTPSFSSRTDYGRH